MADLIKRALTNPHALATMLIGGAGFAITHSFTSGTDLSICALAYGMLAEGFWIAVGGVAGGGGVYLGALSNMEFGTVSHWLVLFTTPGGAALSGLAAAGCLATGRSFDDRLRFMVGLNALMGMIGFLFGSGGQPWKCLSKKGR